MKTTMLIVEFLVGGILVLLALIFLIGSVFLGDILAIPRTLAQDQSLPAGILLLLSTTFVAIAYAVGVFLEPFAREMFEWMLNGIKKESLEEDKVGIMETPVLKEVGQMKAHGLMRFDVLMKSSKLYQDIASQLHRYRLMRISFLAEIIFILAIIGQLLQEHSSISMWALALITVIFVLVFPPMYDRFERYCRAVGNSDKTGEKSSKMKVIRLGFFALYALVVVFIVQLLQEDSSPLISLLAILILIAALNVVVIRDRFERYCRSVERSYKVLLAEKTKMGTGSVKKPKCQN